MASFACTRPVNPPGGPEPVLTADQVWKGLEHKARNPSLFVSAITSCDVVKDEGNKVTRLVSINGGPKAREDIESYPNAVIYFDFADKPIRVLNLLSHGPSGELLLTYSFAGGIPGTDPTVERSIAEKNEMVGSIIDHTLQVIRDLIRADKL